MFKSICPKLNNHLTVYRGEDLPLNTDNTQSLIKSHAGDYIRFKKENLFPDIRIKFNKIFS